MYKIFLLVSAFIFHSCFVSAQLYSVLFIPKDLLKANAVVRNSNIRIEIKSEGKATLNYTYALTILNHLGDRYAGLEVQYDKLMPLKYISGCLYDANGKKLKSISKSDFSDRSSTSAISLAEDDRVKEFDFNWNIYPYTVEYEYEIEIKSLFYLPDWYPVIGENVSVENSHFSISLPSDFKLNYKNYNTSPPKITESKNEKELKWTLQNFQAIRSEALSDVWYKSIPTVLTAPDNFQLKSYNGSMATWNSLGSFYHTLNKGRDELTDPVKEKVHQLTDQLKTTKEKIETLYRYMQQNTRYISVQLGIGGLQTFDAKYVCENKFGDCKALSNFMISLLKEANIKAWAALIYAGDGKTNFEEDFPSHQFNHMIVCVPEKNDTIWLECTDQNKSFGYMGSFTSNRPALLITENGGYLVKTPTYTYQQNLQSRSIKGNIDAQGNVKMNIVTNYQAEQQEDIFNLTINNSKTEVDKYLKEKLSVPSYDLHEWKYSYEKKQIPSVKEELTITAYNYASLTGKRLFITPNILNRLYRTLPDTTQRKTPLILKYEYTDIDSVEIKIPENYTVETSIKNTDLHTPYGNYSITMQILNNTILYTRKMEIYSGKFPPSAIVSYVVFLEEIKRNDASRIVFVKNQ